MVIGWDELPRYCVMRFRDDEKYIGGIVTVRSWVEV